MIDVIDGYPVGSLVHLTASFADAVTGNPVNPDAVVLKIKDPNGVPTTIDPANDELGEYSHDVDVEVSGEWLYRWIGTGAHQAAAEGSFIVLPSDF